MNYQQQATDLLNAMGVKFTAKYLNYGKHFAEDKESRHRFTLKLSRGKRSFSVKFGQSIMAGSKTPTAYDMLTCLTKYDIGSFENFCGDFGYDTDSRAAERTYKAVCKEWEKVSGFFTSEEIEQLQEIQ
jgi:hypothetical protein